jgi:hypothetical protein
VGDVFSRSAAGVVESAALIQAEAEGPIGDGGQLSEELPAFDYALVAALLFNDLPGVRAVLAEEGQSLSALRDSFLAQTERVFGEGAASRWRRFVRVAGANLALANFAADRPEGEDALEIEPDIRAFASVIAARAVRPPLSIGLFGDWGSGKSFFMHRLRQQIAALSASATRPSESDPGTIEEDPTSPFWPNIVQVEFNAWHYVESNLWASLVAHLFSSLSKPEGKAEAEHKARQETLIRDLNIAAALQQKLQDERRAALDHLRRTQLLAGRFRREREKQKRELTKFELLRSIPWQQVAELALDKAAVEHARVGDLGALQKLRSDIESEIDETRHVGERAGRLLEAARSLGVETALWLGGAIVLGIGAFFLAGLMIEEGMFHSAATGIVVTLVPLLGWLRRVRGKATAALSILEQTKANIERAALLLPSPEESEAQQKLAAVEATLRRIEEQAQQAAERVEHASAALTEFRTTSSVAHFLRERAVSGDYREQLGLLALIRNDFEELSRRLRRARGEGEGGAKAAAPLPVTDPNRIDRIVLFIDDLDRCPPERVFEVLEAIHLLLAFDLFVVIVGVDARWLSRALAMARAGLLADSSVESGKMIKALEIEESARPSDFLEKIFQIPFWLQSVDRDAFGRLVDQLVAGDLPQKSDPGGGGAGSGIPVSTGGGTQLANRGVGPGAQPAGRALGLEDVVDAEAEKILIEPFERDCMRDLASVVGRSPRAAKAFVNIWRVLKARESIARVLAPLRPEESCGGLLLLALVVGHPNGAETILDLVQSAPSGTSVQTLFSVPEGDLKRMPAASSSQAPVSPVLYQELARTAQRHLGNLTTDVLRTWLPTVRRFSFDATVARNPTYVGLFRHPRASNGL